MSISPQRSTSFADDDDDECTSANNDNKKQFTDSEDGDVTNDDDEVVDLEESEVDDDGVAGNNEDVDEIEVKMTEMEDDEEDDGSIPSPGENLDEDISADDQSEESVQRQLPANVAGAYAPLIRRRLKQEMEITGIVPLPPRIIGGVHDQEESDNSKACRCLKSHCLKLYCDCFAAGIHCAAFCNCVACKNDGASEHEPFRKEAILLALETTSNAFRYVPDVPGSTVQIDAKNLKATGCNCKKSRCLKVSHGRLSLRIRFSCPLLTNRSFRAFRNIASAFNRQPTAHLIVDARTVAIWKVLWTRAFFLQEITLRWPGCRKLRFSSRTKRENNKWSRPLQLREKYLQKRRPLRAQERGKHHRMSLILMQDDRLKGAVVCVHLRRPKQFPCNRAVALP